MMGPKKARHLLVTGRLASGAEAERMGLVSLAVPSEKLKEAVDRIAEEVAAVPHHGALYNKEALNMALEIQGVGALFR
jgi:enoyl-CoA hydratase